MKLDIQSTNTTLLCRNMAPIIDINDYLQ